MKGDIKYSYCYDENGELIHITSLLSGKRTKHNYTCIECGNEMHARIGHGYVTPHFAHNPDVSCNGETYLHKLAKRKIKEHFLSSKDFKLLQKHEVPCSNEDNCNFYDKNDCFYIDERQHNLKDYFDACKEEVQIKGFVADLLMSKSDYKDREPSL